MYACQALNNVRNVILIQFQSGMHCLGERNRTWVSHLLSVFACVVNLAEHSHPHPNDVTFTSGEIEGPRRLVAG